MHDDFNLSVKTFFKVPQDFTSYPCFSITSLIWFNATCSESYSTITFSLSNCTLTDFTPCRLPKLPSIVLTQCQQDIPFTVIDSCFISYTSLKIIPVGVYLYYPVPYFKVNTRDCSQTTFGISFLILKSKGYLPVCKFVYGQPPTYQKRITNNCDPSSYTI